MPRPRNQSARRQQLLEAALQVINERGPADMQMKDVAGAAGLAIGSVYYYYDNVDDLLRHVHQMAFERYYTSRVEAVKDLPDVVTKVRKMVDMGLPTPDDVPLSLALYQVAVARARDPQHQKMITDLCGMQVLLYQQLLDDGVADGRFTLLASSRRIAENIIALEDGYGLGLATGNHDYDFTEARDSILEAVSLWTQCADLRPEGASDRTGLAGAPVAKRARSASRRTASGG